MRENEIMGLNICLAAERDGKLYELPASPWPEPGWDSGRYGGDYDFLEDLWPGDGEPGAYGHDEWRDIHHPDDDYVEDERVFRPTPERIALLRKKHADNERCQRLCDLLESDETMVVFVI